MKVYIIGAGPGDPELITVKGQKLISTCPVVLYTGSLVPPEVITMASGDAKVLNSAGMTLDEIMTVIQEAADSGHDVARVHTGDPSIFGSTAEQMRRMDRLGISYEIVPGVSSFVAAAAALNKELTLPEISQTVIISRGEGRTPVPSSERLEVLAQSGATLALFLSITLIRKVTRQLIPFYGEDCPVAVVHKASCPEQIIVKGTLKDITKKVTEARITSQSMILIGKVLDTHDFAESRLYAADFSHGYRKAEVQTVESKS
ncbi:precorrin-4 C(11)-methyltransferase [Pseudobacteriovorax antillogorgiicola]|uniref:Precorrin-4 C11-methyltransferase n=1 Tax=Pseudobacteriovorax antillogorgiicola TaxID=1513793 RepID=A0A1Y6C153_9BACT|nr:precorrin-4 C(11)-methyltransferase [Pseudobacteriovorax antillogorgiicola]TCS50680.1 precorrin-4 C11-methyltransferase [Pseudobacteriovorax antillogorgiicola]SMF40121.1 precorrin-4 C11-methyltransferase [Pseudobacteriovorax antillogorgiicola]